MQGLPRRGWYIMMVFVATNQHRITGKRMYIRSLQLFCTETKYISYMSQHKTATMIFALQPSHLTRNNHIFIIHSGCNNYKSMILSHLTFSSEWYNINQHLHKLARKIVYTGQRAICHVFTGSLMKCIPHGLVNVIVNVKNCSCKLG